MKTFQMTAHFTRGLYFIAACLQGAATAHAFPPEPDGARGTLTITTTLKTLQNEEVLDFDGKGKRTTTVDQTTKVTCPVETYGVDPTSWIDGASGEQTAALDALGAAAQREMDAISPDTVASMEALEKEFKACQRSGKSEEVCGMAMMAKMSANPALLESMGNIGNADPTGMEKAQRGVDAAAGKFQVWFSEACTGTMKVNNSSKTTNASGRLTTNWAISGERTFTGESLITAETDMNRSSTRYVHVPAEASGFVRTGVGGANTATVSSMPATVVAGPVAGPIKSGTHEEKVPGGTLKIDWVWQRAR
jgi:hypothetical protein